MFDRFTNSARSVIFRAREIVELAGRTNIEPPDVLLALVELHPQMLAGIATHEIDLEVVRGELAKLVTPSKRVRVTAKVRMNEPTRQLMQAATLEARSYWEEWEAPKRKKGEFLAEDRVFWESRLSWPLKESKRSYRLTRWFGRLALRRRWEVDERHLLVGFLRCPDNPGTEILRGSGAELESARRSLYASVK